jgi:hypothetical protein
MMSRDLTPWTRASRASVSVVLIVAAVLVFGCRRSEGPPAGAASVLGSAGSRSPAAFVDRAPTPSTADGAGSKTVAQATAPDTREVLLMPSADPDPSITGLPAPATIVRVPPSMAATWKHSGADPVLPESLRGRGYKARVKIFVSSRGFVTAVLQDEQDPPSRIAVERALKQWTYRPLVVQGDAMPFSTFVDLKLKGLPPVRP